VGGRSAAAAAAAAAVPGRVGGAASGSDSVGVWTATLEMMPPLLTLVSPGKPLRVSVPLNPALRVAPGGSGNSDGCCNGWCRLLTLPGRGG
jgi:hypothetical protein